MNQEYIIDKELKDMIVSWFEDIEKLSSRLTSGNVSHQGATIRNKAIRCATFIQEFCKAKEEKLWKNQTLKPNISIVAFTYCTTTNIMS